MKQNRAYYAATTIAVLLWSASFIATKIAYQSFQPLMVGFIRFVIASAILGVICVIRRFPRPRGRDFIRIAVSGLLGVTLYFAAENIGVSMTSAANASLIVASFPAITALLEFVIFKIRPDWRKIAGVALAFGGVGVLVLAQDHSGTPQQLWGNLMLIAAGVIWAFYNFITRSIAGRYSPIVLSFWQMAFGSAFFIPLVLAEGVAVRAVGSSGVWAMLYLSVGCSVGAFMLYNIGLRRLSAAASVSLMNLVPVFGLIFSAWLLDEAISLRQIAGGAIVIAGVILSSRTSEPQ